MDYYVQTETVCFWGTAVRFERSLRNEDNHIDIEYTRGWIRETIQQRELLLCNIGAGIYVMPRTQSKPMSDNRQVDTEHEDVPVHRYSIERPQMRL